MQLVDDESVTCVLLCVVYSPRRSSSRCCSSGWWSSPSYALDWSSSPYGARSSTNPTYARTSCQTTTAPAITCTHHPALRQPHRAHRLTPLTPPLPPSVLLSSCSTQTQIIPELHSQDVIQPKVIEQKTTREAFNQDYQTEAPITNKATVKGKAPQEMYSTALPTYQGY